MCNVAVEETNFDQLVGPYSKLKEKYTYSKSPANLRKIVLARNS